MDEIVNRVADSQLDVFDLEDYYPAGQRMELDIAQWLTEGILLKEKEFRGFLKDHDWQQYQGVYLAVFCSTDAIIPAWAEMLVALYAAPHAKKIISGKLSDIDSVLYNELLAGLDYTVYQDKPVIIKGCARKPVPVNAYLLAAQYLQPFAKSIMYGEACSAVPLYKRRQL
ncbi:MAG TPA: DUF2480 family protein [Flavobacterium sp.]|jgi:hypothetical protein